MSGQGPPPGANLTPGSVPAGSPSGGWVQPNPSAAAVTAPSQNPAATPGTALVAPSATAVAGSATGAGAQIPAQPVSQVAAVVSDVGQGIPAPVSTVPGIPTGSVPMAPVVTVAPEPPIGSMDPAILDAEFEQFIEDTDPALAEERQVLQESAVLLQNALVFKVDGCVITKAEKAFSVNLQVRLSPSFLSICGKKNCLPPFNLLIQSSTTECRSRSNEVDFRPLCDGQVVFCRVLEGVSQS